MGGARETALFEHICAFYVEITNIHRWNWKCIVIIVIKTGSGGVCCPNALGLVRTVRQIPRVNALGIGLPVSHAPSCIETTNPSRTSLKYQFIINLCLQYHVYQGCCADEHLIFVSFSWATGRTEKYDFLPLLNIIEIIRRVLLIFCHCL